MSRSSLALRYLSSISGLWSMESSPSGSGLSQPLKPFFLNVWKHNRERFRPETKSRIWEGKKAGKGAVLLPAKGTALKQYKYAHCVRSLHISKVFPLGKNTLNFLPMLSVSGDTKQKMGGTVTATYFWFISTPTHTSLLSTLGTQDITMSMHSHHAKLQLVLTTDFFQP